MPSKYNFCILSIILIVCSCIEYNVPVEDIDFPKSNNEVQIVVNGGIFAMDGYQAVMLSTPGQWPDKSSSEPILSAIVSVSDGINTYSYQQTDSLPGVYQSTLPFSGVPGRVYTLSIVYEERSYLASDTLIAFDSQNVVLPIDGVRHDFGSYAIDVRFHQFGYKVPFRMSSQGNTDLSSAIPSKSDSLSALHLILRSQFDVTFNVGNPPQGLFNSEVYLEALWGKPSDTMLVYYESLSPQYYDYLVDFFNETDWAMGPFVSQPGNLPTNVSEGGLGYFFASDVEVVAYPMADLVDRVN